MKTLDKSGLPSNPEAERLVLGSIVLNDALFPEAAGIIGQADFAIEKNRRIFAAMEGLYAKGALIDRVSLADALVKTDRLEAVGGLSYLVSLDEGLPETGNLAGYAEIVRDKATLRRLAIHAQGIVDRCCSGADDPQQIIADAGAGLLGLEAREGRDGMASVAEVIEAYPGGLQAFVDASRRSPGIQTGFMRLDDLTGGLGRGDLAILAGRPSMGKTALALNIAANVINHGKRVAFFSLEMSPASLLQRMLCSEAGVDQHRFRRGFMGAEERGKIRDKVAWMNEAPIWLDDSDGATLHGIHAKLRRAKHDGGVDLVIVDYLQMMDVARAGGDNRNEQVGSLSRGLKLMAKEMDAPFLVLSQLNRASEKRTGDRMPMLSDLRDSGSIEQDADLVMFIHREEVYKKDDLRFKGLADLIIAKQRNGPLGTVPLRFFGSAMRFVNIAQEEWSNQ